MTFTATVQNGGDSPLFSWDINGQIQSETSTTFSTNELADGDLVQCTFATSLMCASPLPALSNILEIAVDSCENSTLERIPNTNWTIQPNPVFDNMKITTNGYFNILKVEVVNMMGQTIVTELITHPNRFNATLNLNHLESGLYILRISNNQAFGVKKFVKY